MIFFLDKDIYKCSEMFGILNVLYITTPKLKVEILTFYVFQKISFHLMQGKI